MLETGNPLPRGEGRVRADLTKLRAASFYGGRRAGLAGTLRSTSTDAEALLWSKLPSRTLGAKFRRQQPIGSYVVDFYCHEYRLIIEIDGGHHFEDERARADAERSAWLTGAGFSILRFTNREVLREIDHVLDEIANVLEDLRGQPSP